MPEKKIEEAKKKASFAEKAIARQKQLKEDIPELEILCPDKAIFDVGGQKLFMRPLPIGRIKKLYQTIADAFLGYGEGKFETKELEKAIFGNLSEVMKLIFDESKHKFLTNQFIEDNFTIPMVKNVFKVMAIVNQVEEIGSYLKNFFSLSLKNE
ncbi:unnamed protein product [marine sediment metagenome]|uniref:Uncharacterized protein n=1 Tax=marine sediment metagenome TaxID=412755 RepID=X0WK17_9ZZZZ